ncbi:hypothetical protein CTAYLR_008673 [Chrysophaeum taylorii]|uniref:monogalactosyldiacylglycerol synthase n=1 Tax=Chrysophaeum taylorii TaxID=2483200 RepID=A0AAD7UQ57_9STRA|nr:hypothetical protein CTAYLR_008673 [Chrysophaeum taylorii]
MGPGRRRRRFWLTWWIVLAAQAASCLGAAKTTALAPPPTTTTSTWIPPRWFRNLWRRHRKFRVLVLMSDTGGGHRASALALAQALEKLYPGAFDIELLDIWSAAGVWPLNQLVRAYKYLGRRPMLWRLLWYSTASVVTRGTIKAWHDAQHRRRFASELGRRRFDAVVSVHPLTQHVPLSALRQELKSTVPFVTVVTDLGSAHPMWFDSRVDRVFVPNAKVARLAMSHGLERRQITEHGLPLRAAFFAGPTPWTSWKQHRRRRLEQLAQRRAIPGVAIVGGGGGVGRLDRLVDEAIRALEARAQRAHLTVICGTNRGLRAALDNRPPSRYVRIRTEGFVSNIHDIMARSDVLLTKAGPGTIAEAATLGLPVLLTTFLPGQERGNARLVVDRGFGVLERRPDKVAALLCDWLDDPAKLAQLSQRAFDAAKPDSTDKIATDIASMLFSSIDDPTTRDQNLN